MKKGIIVLFIISTFFPCIANATYHLIFFGVRNYTYENGNQLNRLAFGVVDVNNKYPSTNVLDSVVLTDPSGKNVNITMPVRFSSYMAEEGYYDANSSQWIYPPFYFVSEYATEFLDLLIAGTYHLTFADKDGEVSRLNYDFNGIVALPIIPSSSYSYYRDQDGKFILQWQTPYIDPNIQTSVRARIHAYDELNKLVGMIDVKVPNYIDEVFVPKNKFEQILYMGKTHTLGTQIRTNDSNNRAYSTEVTLPNLLPQPTACTATLDGTLSLHVTDLSYANPSTGTLLLWTDFVYYPNPSYPTLIPFKLTNYAIINNPSFSCAASTLSSSLAIHIPDVLLPDGITHLWVDLEYSPALSIDGNFYWVVSNYGAISN